jgi:mannose PTS system EIIA component
MVGIVIIAHGKYAEELIQTAQFIVGNIEQCVSVNVFANDGPDQIRKELQQALKDVDDGDGVLVLTDMFGGTPSNIALSFLMEGKVEVLTGSNIPMMLKLATGRKDMPLKELAVFIKQYGQRNISLASEILNQRPSKEKK